MKSFPGQTISILAFLLLPLCLVQAPSAGSGRKIASSRSENNFINRFDRFSSVCGRQKWNQLKCEFAKSKSDATWLDYRRGPLNGISDYFHPDGRAVVSGLRTAEDSFGQLRSEWLDGVASMSGTDMATIIDKKLSRISLRNPGMSDCQKVCLAACASTTLISFDNENPDDFSWSIAEILESGKGDCQSFASAAEHFARALGMNQSSFITGQIHGEDGHWDNHAWLGARLPNGYFWIEPQSMGCEFTPEH